MGIQLKPDSCQTHQSRSGRLTTDKYRLRPTPQQPLVCILGYQSRHCQNFNFYRIAQTAHSSSQVWRLWLRKRCGFLETVAHCAMLTIHGSKLRGIWCATADRNCSQLFVPFSISYCHLLCVRNGQQVENRNLTRRGQQLSPLHPQILTIIPWIPDALHHFRKFKMPAAYWKKNFKFSCVAHFNYTQRELMVSRVSVRTLLLYYLRFSRLWVWRWPSSGL
jgi:hypothetical protein